ncbi:tiggy-winkle hedgehog protein-like [Watersipora subatra]|uniref:tiggy-winkle hedgehog protein-like n=1 Tax=Watersipora subatra TaxID=2589382 RepID=UPI00355B781D
MAKVLNYFISLFLQVFYAYACLSGGRTSLRGRPGRMSNREPLIYKQYVPNRSEMSISASGPANGRITRESPDFSKLVENNNLDIIFKDEEGTGADRMMTNRCKDKLNSLAIMVMNQWQDVRLRVIEGWDEEGAHAVDSLHYEGRAVDITTSDKDREKLPLLARLAYDAGFDFVFYESKHHIHCSVRSDDDEYNSMGSGFDSGCFASGTRVAMADGTTKLIEDLAINDQVLVASPESGEITTDTVFMFLDRAPSSVQEFTELSYNHEKLTLTNHHLVYASNRNDSSFLASAPTYAKDITEGSYVFVNVKNSLILQQVLLKKQVAVKGFYAPVTLSGNIVVNGVVSSCYASINNHWLAHTALAPLRFLYKHFNVTGFSAKMPQAGVHWYAKVLIYVFPFLLS